METITVQISQRAYDGFAKAAIDNGITIQSLINELCQNTGISYANINKIGIVSNGRLMLRLTEQELFEIKVASSKSIHLAKLLKDLQDNPEIHLDDPKLLAGIQQLVYAGLLDEGRVADLLAYDRPRPQ